MRIIDLHTDFILGERKLDKLFGVNTHTQINKGLAQRGNIEVLMAGFSYDDMNNNTDEMLTATEDYVKISDKNPKVIIHLEGAEILSKSKSLLNEYYKRGVRSIGLAHIEDNSLCGSSSSNKNLGLTKRGKELINEALKLNMIVDLAHMSNQSFTDSLNLLDNKPPLISHTACYTLENNVRNNRDEEINLVGKLGGVVGIFFSGKYINSKKTATINDVANHIKHAVDIAGIDSVGIGSDFGGITSYTPQGLETADKLANLHNLLLNIGFTKKDLSKIFYENAYRVLNNYINLTNYE